MPPVSQQSSRAGLITTVVIFAILTVAFIGTTFYCNSQWQTTDKSLKDLETKYRNVANEADLSNSDVTGLEQPGKSPAIEAALAQIKDLTKAIQGTPGSADVGQKAADATVTNTVLEMGKAPYGLSLPKDAGLTGLAAAMEKAIVDNQSALSAADKQRDDALAQLAASQTLQKAELTKRDQAVTAAQAQVTAMQQKLNDDEAAMTKQIAAANANATQTLQANGQQLQTLVQKIQQEDAQIATLNRQIEAFKNVIAARHIGPEEVMVRQSDGHISRVPSPGVAFIDLGSADHITPGLTFEVYDSTTGVPGLGDGVSNEGMPIGKGSIEVIHVGQNSSECRIVSTKPGDIISEGDIIANLVYDKNTKYNFFVYGDFDPDQSGIWSAQKAAVIKDLVHRWGGNLVDHIGPDTDYVVVGREPELPNFSKEDLDSNPVDNAMYTKAKAAAKAYDDVVEAAKDLHIPVMNQNRFLYYTGYYEMAKR